MFNLFRRNKKTCMEREILAQSKIAQGILEAYITQDNKIDIDTPSNINRIIIVASGSSYHCGRYAAELFRSIAKIEAQSIYSSEFLLQDSIGHEEGILYIFITQSGETTDTNRSLDKAKEFGVRTLCITNKENSSIWNSSDYKIACLAGEEKSIAATKSFTSQLLCTTLLALKIAQDKNIDIYNYVLDLKNIPEVINKAFEKRNKIKQVAKFISKHKNIIITADGPSYALAKETALKIKETSYLSTTAAILGEFMHGHVAVLNNKKTTLLYVLNDNISYAAIKNLEKIKTDYNPTICLIGERTNQVKSSYHLDIECSNPIIKTFGLAVIIQLLALEIAKRLRRNVDKPHGLNKVVK